MLNQHTYIHTKVSLILCCCLFLFLVLWHYYCHVWLDLISVLSPYQKLIIIKSYTNNNNVEDAQIIAGFQLVKIVRLRIWLADDVISITRYQCKSQLNNMIFLSVSHFFVLCYHQDSWGNYWNKIFEHSPAFEKMMS